MYVRGNPTYECCQWWFNNSTFIHLHKQFDQSLQQIDQQGELTGDHRICDCTVMYNNIDCVRYGEGLDHQCDS